MSKKKVFFIFCEEKTILTCATDGRTLVLFLKTLQENFPALCRKIWCGKMMDKIYWLKSYEKKIVRFKWYFQNCSNVQTFSEIIEASELNLCVRPLFRNFEWQETRGSVFRSCWIRDGWYADDLDVRSFFDAYHWYHIDSDLVSRSINRRSLKSKCFRQPDCAML